jgi:N-acetylglutamate synthase-like GNAT family acetyltransferase
MTIEQPRTVEIIDEPDMTPTLDAGIRELLCKCFPSDREVFSKTRAWHGTAPTYCLVRREGNKVIGHTGVVCRTILVGDTQIHMAGIQNVAVEPQSQGSMLVWAMMRKAMREAKRRGIKFGVLFCVPSLERLYAGLKWRTIDIDVTMQDEHGARVPIPGKNICMVLELADEPFPEGDIFLQGMDW